MKVVHIVPAAFDYFDDIKKVATALAETMGERNVETEIITIQYSAPRDLPGGLSGDAKQKKVKHKFAGSVDLNSLVDEFKNFDIVHVHCPILGSIKRICDWKKANPDVPLVTTFYRGIPLQDLFSMFIKWYNYYYLPKLFVFSDQIIYFQQNRPFSGIIAKFIEKTTPIEGKIILTGVGDVVKYKEEITNKILEVYNKFKY